MKKRIISFYTKNKNTINIILRVTVSVSLVVYLFMTQFRDLSSIIEILKSSNKTLMALSLSTHIFGTWITAYRWKTLLNTQDVRLSIATLSAIVLIGSFFNNFLPTSIGGDVFRTYDVSKKAEIPLGTSASIILIERFAGVVSAAVFAVIALFLGFTTIGNQSIVIPIVIFFLICVIIAIIIVNPSIFGINKLFRKFGFLQKMREKLSSVFNTLESFKDYKMVLLKVLIYSFLLQFAVMLNYYLASLAVGIDLGITAFLFMVPVISIITMIPISIGGIGLRENAIVIIMAGLGVMEEKAAVCSLLILVMLLIVGIIGGIVYILRPYFEKPRTAVDEK